MFTAGVATYIFGHLNHTTLHTPLHDSEAIFNIIVEANNSGRLSVIPGLV